MKLAFEGWYNEHQEKMRTDDIWKKGCITYTRRMDGFIDGFEPIEGEDEEGISYYYDAVRVFVYLGENGKEVDTKEFVPWYDGEEVRNIEIPYWLQEKVENLIRNHPVPTL